MCYNIKTIINSKTMFRSVSKSIHFDSRITYFVSISFLWVFCIKSIQIYCTAAGFPPAAVSFSPKALQAQKSISVTDESTCLSSLCSDWLVLKCIYDSALHRVHKKPPPFRRCNLGRNRFWMAIIALYLLKNLEIREYYCGFVSGI